MSPESEISGKKSTGATIWNLEQFRLEKSGILKEGGPVDSCDPEMIQKINAMRRIIANVPKRPGGRNVEKERAWYPLPNNEKIKVVRIPTLLEIVLETIGNINDLFQIKEDRKKEE